MNGISMRRHTRTKHSHRTTLLTQAMLAQRRGAGERLTWSACVFSAKSFNLYYELHARAQFLLLQNARAPVSPTSTYFNVIFSIQHRFTFTSRPNMSDITRNIDNRVRVSMYVCVCNHPIPPPAFRDVASSSHRIAGSARICSQRVHKSLKHSIKWRILIMIRQKLHYSHNARARPRSANATQTASRRRHVDCDN